MTASAESEDNFRVNNLPPYALGSIASAVNEARLKGRDIVDLSQINPDLGPPSSAVDKLVQASLLPHNHRYSSSQGITKLREAICSLYAKRYGVELAVENEAVVTLGTKEGLTHLLLAICNPGETIIVPTPTYPVHSAGIGIAGASRVAFPLYANWETAAASGYRLSENDESFFERLDEAVKATWPRPKCMIVNFPHNPTATTVTSGFWTRLVEFATREKIFLIHDFSYADIAFDNTAAPSLLAAPGAKDIAVEFYSLSKGLNLAGWRVGFCVGNPKLCSALKKIKSYIDFGLFQPLQVGAVQALSKIEDTAKEIRATYSRRQEILVAGLRDLGWNVSDSKATVFLWAEMPERLRGEGSLRLSHRLLSEADVAVCPGVGFDPHGDAFIRFALGENESRIRKALERLESWDKANGK